MNARIAVVNHNPHLLRLYREYLGRKGYEVSEFHEDADSLTAIEQWKPDLIILGDLNGIYPDEWHFLQELRRQPVTANTPVILASTSVTLIERSPHYAMQSNVFLLSKPFEVAQLNERVEQALGRAGEWT